MRVIILGPPGSGKGTRAKIIGKLYGIPVITTGDLLREAVAHGTAQGRLAKTYMEQGELVQDEIVISIVKEKLMKEDLSRGFILDGFPRNLTQAEALDRILRDRGVELDFVLFVKAEPETIVKRLSLRRSCPKCGSVYHLKDRPPKRDELCDECGSMLIQRPDDREEVIRHRLEIYEESTRPILKLYMNQGKVREISGEMDIDEIPDAVRRVLEG
ncbi:MAG: adenylate kinase [Candidatus Bathyarchaeia archaeon]